MQQMGSFIVGHWELFLALVVILFLLARTWFGPGAVSLLMPSEAIQLINHKDALVVDVRTDKEYQQGHVMNALHIPLGVLDNRIAELQAYKASPMVMVCRSGARSGQAASKLKKLGFTEVHNLGGGMLAWERASLPVTTKVGTPPKPSNTAAVSGETPEEDSQENVLVYTTRKCPFCTRAIELLEAKGVGYTEVRIDTYPERREEMESRANRTSVPQIFIGDTHVGGCDDMYELEDRGELDALLDLSSQSTDSSTDSSVEKNAQQVP
jgi:GrxC family glutaredoxin